MDDEFLHRLRREPPADFAVRLKQKLDRPEPLRRYRPVMLGLAIFGTAFALTTPVARLAVREWFSQPPASVPGQHERPRTGWAAIGLHASTPAASIVQRRPSPIDLASPVPATPPQRPAEPAVSAVESTSATPPARVLVVGSALAPSSAQGALAAVMTRRGLFHVMAWVMQPLGSMAGGASAFDPQRLALAAARLRELAPMIPDLYAVDTHSTDVPTSALPDIWVQPGAFQAKAYDLMDAANLLAQAAAAHDREASLRAIAAITAACQACHAVYVQK